MFEWIFAPLRWIAGHTEEFFSPYINMGVLFWIITIGFMLVYVYLVFGGKKEIEEEIEEKS